MVEDCCGENRNNSLAKCPVNGLKGKPVKLITLKNLLKPEALTNLNCQTQYFFCAASDCPVVYFNQAGQQFTTEQVKVAVFQKDKKSKVPVCYCFNWTRERLVEEIKQRGFSTAENSIRAQVKLGNCHCEVNNPQGSCCLANIRNFIPSIKSC